MKEIILKVYDFEELSEEVQKKLVEEEIEFLIEINFNCLQELYKNMMLEDGIDDLKIFYSLSYSQGDGVSFEGVIDFEKDNVFKKVLDNSKYKQEITNILKEGFAFRLVRNSNFYYHKYTCDIENDIYYCDEKTKEVLNEFEEQLKREYFKLCDGYEKFGYSCYEVSEEDAIESILERDFLYFEDGRIYK